MTDMEDTHITPHHVDLLEPQLGVHRLVCDGVECIREMDVAEIFFPPRKDDPYNQLANHAVAMFRSVYTNQPIVPFRVGLRKDVVQRAGNYLPIQIGEKLCEFLDKERDQIWNDYNVRILNGKVTRERRDLGMDERPEAIKGNRVQPIKSAKRQRNSIEAPVVPEDVFKNFVNILPVFVDALNKTLDHNLATRNMLTTIAKSMVNISRRVEELKAPHLFRTRVRIKARK
jgi:hypothetical protein